MKRWIVIGFCSLWALSVTHVACGPSAVDEVTSEKAQEKPTDGGGKKEGIPEKGAEKVAEKAPDEAKKPDTVVVVNACELYCDNALANCTGADQVYASKRTCLAACKAMPKGKKGDTSGNTAFCRAYHAGGPAKGDPEAHCPHASITSSGNVCGSPCDAYCDQITANCTGVNKQHKDRAACMSWCKTKKVGKWKDKSGDTIACRAYHASFPAATSADTHCPHAGISGGGVCVDKELPVCEAYCKNVMENCTGSNQVYANKAACMAACKAMPKGKKGDKSGNTAYCRAYHAGAPAKSDPKTHCPHAGITSGNGRCGQFCEAYCDQVTANCTGANAQHKDRAACMSWCKGKKIGNWNDTSGDSIACRAYHASFPAASDAKTHCPHAGPSGGGVCVDKTSAACLVYCKNVTSNCTGSNQVFANQAACMAACKAMPEGNKSDKSGNTAYCRAYHAGAPAKANAKTHCPHASISSASGVCGTACDAYCSQVMRNCTGANAQHKNIASCMSWCKRKKVGKWNDTSGDTIACRAYHASFPAASNASLHCPHAGPSGGGVCVDKGPKCKKSFASCTSFTDLTATGASRVISFGGGVGLKYSPKCIKIKSGQTVTFKGSFAGHPLETACQEKATIRATSSGTTYSAKLTATGYYNYYCKFHGSASGTGMAGNIWVVP